jgi:hypothetical protein
VRYDWLVNVILTVHFAYLGYVVLGGFLAWRWPRALYWHVAAGVWGVLIVLELVDCPLTWAEHWARQRNGEAPSNAGFIERYVTDVIYPEQYLRQVQGAVAAVVLVSWIGALALWRRRRARQAAAARAGQTPPPDQRDPGDQRGPADRADPPAGPIRSALVGSASSASSAGLAGPTVAAAVSDTQEP